MRAAAASTLRRLPRVGLAIPPKVRRRLVAVLLLAMALAALYRLWFRDSSFVSVQHVTVSGLTTKDAPRIRTALTAAAHDMSTLNMNQAALDSAVSGFPIVRTVVARASFPHTLEIHVVEQQPVAVLEVGGERLLLAPDGSVLRDVATGHPLAVIRTNGSVPQDMLTEHAPLAALHVAAAAPAALADRITSIGHDKLGIEVHLRNGPRVVFGDDSRPVAKWAAVAAVLADPSSKGASYVDVRLPGRPVAGGLAAETLAPLSSTGNDTSAQSNTQSSATGVTGTPEQPAQSPSSATPLSATPPSATSPSVTSLNPQPSTGG